jgi:hypothetical protein
MIDGWDNAALQPFQVSTLMYVGGMTMCWGARVHMGIRQTFAGERTSLSYPSHWTATGPHRHRASNLDGKYKTTRYNI